MSKPMTRFQLRDLRLDEHAFVRVAIDKIAEVQTVNGWTVEIADPPNSWYKEMLEKGVDIGAKAPRYKYKPNTQNGWEPPAGGWAVDFTDELEDALLTPLEEIFEAGPAPGGNQVDFEALFAQKNFVETVWEALTSGDYDDVRKMLRPFYNAQDTDALVQALSTTPNLVKKTQNLFADQALSQAQMKVFYYTSPPDSGDAYIFSNNEDEVRNWADEDKQATFMGYSIYTGYASLEDWLDYELGSSLDTRGDARINTVDAKFEPEDVVNPDAGGLDAVLALDSDFAAIIYRSFYMARNNDEEEEEIVHEAASELDLLEWLFSPEGASTLEQVGNPYPMIITQITRSGDWEWTKLDRLRETYERLKADEQEAAELLRYQEETGEIQMGLPGIEVDENVRVPVRPRKGDYVLAWKPLGGYELFVEAGSPTRSNLQDATDLFYNDREEAIQDALDHMQTQGFDNPRDPTAPRLWEKDGNNFKRLQWPVDAGHDPWPYNPNSAKDRQAVTPEILADAFTKGMISKRDLDHWLANMTSADRFKFDELIVGSALGPGYQTRDKPLAPTYQTRQQTRRVPQADPLSEDISYPRSKLLPSRPIGPDTIVAGPKTARRRVVMKNALRRKLGQLSHVVKND